MAFRGAFGKPQKKKHFSHSITTDFDSLWAAQKIKTIDFSRFWRFWQTSQGFDPCSGLSDFFCLF
jgi:hypothetical protein